MLVAPDLPDQQSQQHCDAAAAGQGRLWRP
jgi:hypothetical protein